MDCLGAAAAGPAAPWVEDATPVPAAVWLLAGQPEGPIPHPFHEIYHLGYIPREQMVILYLVNLCKKKCADQSN